MEYPDVYPYKAKMIKDEHYGLNGQIFEIIKGYKDPADKGWLVIVRPLKGLFPDGMYQKLFYHWRLEPIPNKPLRPTKMKTVNVRCRLEEVFP